MNTPKEANPLTLTTTHYNNPNPCAQCGAPQGGGHSPTCPNTPRPY